MTKQYIPVYVETEYTPETVETGEVEVDADVVYLTIPKQYVCVYHKLLVYLADFGENVIKDCKAMCNNNNLYIIQCWNMFQSAIACYTLGLLDKADLFIDYIEAQLDLLYKGTDKEVYCGGSSLPITEDGKLKARVSCAHNGIKFYVDEETKELYEEILSEKQNTPTYTIEDNNLIETNGN